MGQTHMEPEVSGADHARIDDLADALDHDEAAVETSLGRLEKLGMVSRLAGSPTRMRAARPDVAIKALVSRRQEELAQTQLAARDLLAEMPAEERHRPEEIVRWWSAGRPSRPASSRSSPTHVRSCWSSTARRTLHLPIAASWRTDARALTFADVIDSRASPTAPAPANQCGIDRSGLDQRVARDPESEGRQRLGVSVDLVGELVVSLTSFDHVPGPGHPALDVSSDQRTQLATSCVELERRRHEEPSAPQVGGAEIQLVPHPHVALPVEDALNVGVVQLLRASACPIMRAPSRKARCSGRSS